MNGGWYGGGFETQDRHLMVPELRIWAVVENRLTRTKYYGKLRRKMGALHHFSASAVAREGSCEGARGCLLNK